MAKKRKRKSKNNQHIAKWVGYGLLAIFIGSVLWSMWVDTLRPLLRSGDTAGFMNNLIGLPIILVATAVIVYGGYRVLMATLTTFGSENLQKNLAVITGKEARTNRRAAQWENAKMFFRGWAPGAAIMLLGFVLMGVGGWLINR